MIGVTDRPCSTIEPSTISPTVCHSTSLLLEIAMVEREREVIDRTQPADAEERDDEAFERMTVDTDQRKSRR